MDIKRLINKLHPLERKIIPLLGKYKDFDELVKNSGLQEVQVIKAVSDLEYKNVLKLNVEEKKFVVLSDKAKNYKELPERTVIKNLNSDLISLDQLKKKTNLNDIEINVSVGLLKKGYLVEVSRSNGLCVKLSEKGKKEGDKKSEEEELFSKLLNERLNLSDVDKNVFELLRNRGLVSLQLVKDRRIILNDLGRELTKSNLNIDLIDQVTTEIIKDKSWEKKSFRSYDIKVEVPRVHSGRLHPLQETINQIRRIFMDMGFQEMEGPLVETAFWCMDSMWIPQNHPARDVQDTFFLPYEGKIPTKLAKKVAEMHETGGKCGSKGYGYKWDEKLAKELLMRTHTTATTYRYFGEKNVKAPCKYFYVSRIFRNEAIDATHLPEFHQSEGFIMDEGLTLRDLMGYIKEFYNRMGVYKIKFKPTYNPYTEPSMEAIGYNEQLGKWVELINSGVFRPEALEPYGINVPVIAWGLGVERLSMMLHEQKDIRKVLGVTGDLNWFRNAKVIKKW
ncbi:phenylalanine--tRNA ligase subunit alpha [Candidatus Woesearchaeota archaeon]|nr:phenylalanine--tRNA ligase subunit alpha [Candidatus Woesearchaeota archaeon]